jgi:hypothetical protein
MVKELEDYKWFPFKLRCWQMEFIGNLSVWSRLYKPLVTVLQQIIDHNKITLVQDLCSGSGIPAVYVYNQLNSKPPIKLTDKYPIISFRNQPSVNYSLKPVDINELAPEEYVCYTMFNAFHHFTASQQIEFVKNMANNKAPFLIVEILQPGFFNIVKIFLSTTLLQLLIAPFIKPFSLSRLFFTYIIPVNLFTITYDGIISVLKSKTVKQYAIQLKAAETENYNITVTAIKNLKGNIIYIKGEPKIR